MSGSYYRAKARTGGISGALQPLINFFAKKNAEEEQKQYLLNLFNAYKSTKDRMNQTANTGFDPEVVKRSAPIPTIEQEGVTDSNGNNVLRPPDVERGTQRGIIPTGPTQDAGTNVLNSSTDDKYASALSKPQGNASMEEVANYLKMRNVELERNRQPGVQDKLNALNNQPDIKANINQRNALQPQSGVNALDQRGRINAADNMSEEFFLREMMNPKGNPQVASVLGNALQNQANRLRPKEQKTMNVAKGGDVLGFNEKTGKYEKIYSNEEQPKTPSSVLLGEGTYGGKQGIKYGYIDNNGKEVVTKFDEFNKGTTVNIENKLPQPEKWKGFGKTIADARVTITKDGKNRLLPEEINKNWDDAKAEYKSTMLPQAKTWFENNIEKKGLTTIADKQYLTKIRDAVNKEELTIEEAQDLIDANAYRSDLYGK